MNKDLIAVTAAAAGNGEESYIMLDWMRRSPKAAPVCPECTARIGADVKRAQDTLNNTLELWRAVTAQRDSIEDLRAQVTAMRDPVRVANGVSSG